MKTILPLLALTSIIALTLSSCKHYTFKSATHNGRLVTKTGVMEAPVVADVDVEEEKVFGSFEGKNVPEEEAKRQAVANALRKTDGEVLIQPSYQIEIRDLKEITVKVDGYPGRYTNFRTPSHADSLVLGFIKPKKEAPPVSPNPMGDNYFYNINLKPYDGGYSQSSSSETEQASSPNLFGGKTVSKKEEITSTGTSLNSSLEEAYRIKYRKQKKSARRLTGFGITSVLVGGLWVNVV